jgi:hypothetical protein
MSSLGFSSSGPSSQLYGQYGSEYNTALNLNNQNYQNILSNYGQNVGAVQGQVGNVAAGYGALSQQVQGTIAGIGKSQSQAIQDVYAQQAGGLNQQLTNRGLGNSTVVSSMQRGLTLDSQKAQIALANQIAQLTAGYQSQLGSAGLGAQMQGAGIMAGQGNALGGNLASYKTPYPSWPPNASQSRQSSMSPYQMGGRGGMMGGAGPSGMWSGNDPYANNQVGQMAPNPYGTMSGQLGNTYGSPQTMGGMASYSMNQQSPYGGIGSLLSGVGDAATSAASGGYAGSDPNSVADPGNIGGASDFSGLS